MDSVCAQDDLHLEAWIRARGQQAHAVGLPGVVLTLYWEPASLSGADPLAEATLAPLEAIASLATLEAPAAMLPPHMDRQLPAPLAALLWERLANLSDDTLAQFEELMTSHQVHLYLDLDGPDRALEHLLDLCPAHRARWAARKLHAQLHPAETGQRERF